MIAIIKYGMGNLGSVLNMLRRLGNYEAIITSDLKKIESAEKLILPGVGSFKKAMENLEQGGFLPILEKKVLQNKTPIMGICLGMQLLFSNSSEGGINNGLGLIDGEVRRIKSGYQKIPHIGFDKVNFPSGSKMFAGIEKLDFYFVHSFCVKNYDNASLISHCIYNESFIAAIEKQHIWGTQFHPEKSQKNGLELLRNFLLAHGN